MTTSPSGFCRSEPTLPRKTLGAMPIEQVRHSPTCSRKVRFTFNASSRANRDLALRPHQSARHFVWTAGCPDMRQNPVAVNRRRDDRGAEPPRFPDQGAGFDAVGLGRVAGGNGDGTIR